MYVPASYASDTPANVLYLTHGWWGSAAGLADGVSPVVDELESEGKAAPTLVVFATYYPDRFFATDDYEEDYTLNRFFATSEIDTLIDTVESRYTTFARGDTSDQSLRASRRHRAFGGFSMGATTTWDFLPCVRGTSTGTCRWPASRGSDARRTRIPRASPSW